MSTHFRNIVTVLVAVFVAFRMLQCIRGLLPNARPQFWPRRWTGHQKVQLSRFALISIFCGCLGFGIVLASFAIIRATDAFVLVGFCISGVAFVLVSISLSRDVRRARHTKLPNWIS
jgi:hypothetical protein